MKRENSDKERPSITIREFMEQFSTDEACLQHLFDCRFGQGYACPKCSKDSKWHRFKAERAFACQWCGHHLHPTVGTPFEDTRTPLQLWFYAIYLFTTSRHGVPAKELERQLGVTYKTAWRMAKLIREHMADVDGEHILSGDVEIDETYIGGKKYRAFGGKGKAVVVGMLQRGGEIMTKVVRNGKGRSVIPHVEGNIVLVQRECHFWVSELSN